MWQSLTSAKREFDPDDSYFTGATKFDKIEEKCTVQSDVHYDISKNFLLVMSSLSDVLQDMVISNETTLSSAFRMPHRSL